jgi:hypothetical protein
MLVVGHGCPSLTSVETITADSAPAVKDLDPVLDDVRSGELTRLRKASDRAFWPISGLSVRRETAWLSSNAEIIPAFESPQAELLIHACGPEVVARSWSARIEEDSQSHQDYFFIRRQGQWLVWISITTFDY